MSSSVSVVLRGTFESEQGYGGRGGWTQVGDAVAAVPRKHGPMVFGLNAASPDEAVNQRFVINGGVEVVVEIIRRAVLWWPRDPMITAPEVYDSFENTSVRVKVVTTTTETVVGTTGQVIAGVTIDFKNDLTDCVLQRVPQATRPPPILRANVPVTMGASSAQEGITVRKLLQLKQGTNVFLPQYSEGRWNISASGGPGYVTFCQWAPSYAQIPVFEHGSRVDADVVHFVGLYTGNSYVVRSVKNGIYPYTPFLWLGAVVISLVEVPMVAKWEVWKVPLAVYNSLPQNTVLCVSGEQQVLPPPGESLTMAWYQKEDGGGLFVTGN